MSNFNFDKEQEYRLMPFYDYLDILLKPQGWSIQVNNFKFNSDKQMLGVDCTLKNLETGEVFNCDAKFQTKEYINNPTNTFSLETLFTKDGELKEGWFPKTYKKDTDDKDRKITDIFIFGWFHQAKFVLKKDDHGNLVPFIEKWGDVLIADFMFVHFNDVKNYLACHLIGYDEIVKTSKELFRSSDSVKFVNGIKFVKSDSKKYSESPINIVLNKYIYKNMPNTRMFVYTKEDGFFETSDYIEKDFDVEIVDKQKKYINTTDYKSKIKEMRKKKI